MNAACLVLLLAVVPAQLTEEFAYDFRSARTLPPALQMCGPNADNLAKLEPEGLRIRLPAKRTQLGVGVGVKPRFAVSGDFEITATYELIYIEKPTKGRGSGVSLYIEIGTPMKAAATLARSVRVHEGESYVVWRGLRNGEKRGDRIHVFPTKVNLGKLRLARTGSVLHYLATEEKSEEFHELASEEFANGDVRLIRVVANTGESPTSLDVRLRGLQIRAAGLPKESAIESGSNRAWLVQLLVISGITLVIVGYGVWRLWRQRVASQRISTSHKSGKDGRPRTAIENRNPQRRG